MRGTAGGAAAAALTLCLAVGGAARAEEPTPTPPLFRGALSVGARLGVVARDHDEVWGPRDPYAGPYIPGYADSGASIEADVGYHVVPAFTLYAFWEHTFFVQNGARSVSAPWSELLGLGFHINSHPFAPVGFLADLAEGYRWLTVPLGYPPPPPESVDGHAVTYGALSPETWTYRGWEFVRLALGASFAITRRSRWEVAATVSAGIFTNVDGMCTSCSSSVPPDGRSVHAFGGVSVGTHWDLEP